MPPQDLNHTLRPVLARAGTKTIALLGRSNETPFRGHRAQEMGRPPISPFLTRAGSMTYQRSSPQGGREMRIRNRCRGVLSSATALVIVVALSSWAIVEAAHLKESPRKHRIVYQLDDPGADKAKFVLGNIRNHIAGVGGWQNIEALELVVFGPGLKSFVTASMDPDVRRSLETLQSQGMVFGACGNTMKNFSITLEELPSGATPL